MKKEKGTFGWVFTFAGQKKSGYIASVIFAVIGAAFQILPFFVMAQIMAAAKKARCHDFIMKLPQGYETVIGEAGGSLSGGERQRLSIARAMMKDAPIIILDEATANVDPENEQELMEAIQKLTQEKTVIMIAHRLKTVRHADQILVVDKGRIVQHGTHEELMKQDGIYHHFISGREQAVGWKL